MFTNKSSDGLNNICGKRIAELRVAAGLSQRQLAIKCSWSVLILTKTQFSESNAANVL